MHYRLKHVLKIAVCTPGSSVRHTGAENMTGETVAGDAVCMTGRVLWQCSVYI